MLQTHTYVHAHLQGIYHGFRTAMRMFTSGWLYYTVMYEPTHAEQHTHYHENNLNSIQV